MGNPKFQKQKSTHPALLWGTEEVKALADRLQNDSVQKQQFDEWISDEAELSELQWLTESYADSVYSQHGRYYEIGAQLMSVVPKFSLLYHLTGKQKYARKLIAGMLHYASFRKWTGPSNQDRDTPWHSDLSTTRILYAYAIAYDAVSAAMTEQEREIIRTAMVEKGIRPLLADWVLPGSRVHALDSMGHNWWSVCIALAGVGLCAVYEEVPEAEHWMDLILRALHAFCTYSGEALLNKAPNFDSQGLFYESPNYFNYGIGELMDFTFVFRRLFADGEKYTQFAHIPEVSQAFMSLSYPTSDPDAPLLFPDFGDSHLKGDFDLLPRFMLLCGYDTPELRYACHAFCRKPGLFDFLYPEILGKDAGSLAQLPKNMIFAESGYAFLRTSWEKDARLLAIRCGYTWNHAHDDGGHFILMDRGRAVIPDGGTCDYGLPEYGGYFKTCRAHNMITINGEAQPKDVTFRGSRYPGILSHFVDGEMKYLLADSTGPTAAVCTRNYRSFLWLCPDILVTVDDLRAAKPSAFASLLHENGEASVCQNRISVTGRTRLTAEALWPEAVRITVQEGYCSTEEGVKPRPYHAFEAAEQAEVLQFMTFYGLDEAAELEPERISGKDWIGIRIRYGGTVWTVGYNLLADGRKMHENSNSELFGFETDAYILVLQTGPDGEESVLMAYGSYLRKDGRSLFEDVTKKFIQFSLSGREDLA